MPDRKRDRDTGNLPVRRTELEKIRLLEDLAAIRKHFANLPKFDTLSADEILGYDERGLPT